MVNNTIPIPERKPIPLVQKQYAISESTGSDKLWGPEVRKYVEGIRRGEIDDPDFLRTYEATRKGLGHYTKEEVESTGLDDPFLPAAIKRTTPDSRRARQILAEDRGKYPLVELGLDPTRLITSSVKTNYGGIYNPQTIHSRSDYAKGVMEKHIAASDRPDLYDEGDYIRARQGEHPKNIVFHEAAHRGIQILELETDFELPRFRADFSILDKDETDEGKLRHAFFPKFKNNENERKQRKYKQIQK